MDIAEIKNYDDVISFMDDNDIAAPYFCLDAREVPYSAVYAYDTYEEGTIPSCLESWEIMQAVNSSRANPIFSDLKIEREKEVNIKLNRLEEEHEWPWIKETFLELVYDSKVRPIEAVNFLERLAGALPDKLYFTYRGVEESWEQLKKSFGLSADRSMAVISHLISSGVRISRWQDAFKEALENFQWTDYSKEYPAISKDRISKILLACPELIHDDSEKFLRYQLKPLIAAGFSDSQIADVFRAYKDSPFAIGSLDGAMEGMSGLKISAQDKYEILMYLASRFAANETGWVISQFNHVRPEINGLNALHNSDDIKWLIRFCLDHAEGSAHGALSMAGDLAESGWGALKIEAFVKTVSKEGQYPIYESVEETALAFEEMGVPENDSLYFLENVFGGNLPTGFGWDIKNHAPAIVSALRRKENLSYKEIFDVMIAELTANRYVDKPLEIMRSRLE